MKKYLFLMLAIIGMAVSFTACSSDDDTAYISLNKEDVSILHGQSFTLKVTGTDEKPLFSSENKLIADVDENGVINGNHVGQTNIAVSTSGKTMQCKVTVMPVITFITDPYLNFGATYSDVKNAEKDKIPSTIDKVLDEDPNQLIIIRNIDGLKYAYGYIFTNGKLTDAVIMVNFGLSTSKATSFTNYLLERFAVVTMISTTSYGLISPDKNIACIYNISTDITTAYFTQSK